MGNWNITIQGTGMHHNGKREDANEIAKVCVDTLKKAGQNVEMATFTSGGRESVLDQAPIPDHDPK